MLTLALEAHETELTNKCYQIWSNKVRLCLLADDQNDG